ncbi:MAG TPA: PilZ domain-containing protein [Candidatus Acidoferrales bacterium]|nr:PilZ domain-containing protein [Candidatus Acidoferrales bacterium]
MAAAHQPVDGSVFDPNSWQSLVRDRRYRLFAAGAKRAAIAECLPSQSRAANGTGPLPGPTNFDARYGLAADGAKWMMLLTEVCRVADAAPRRAACGEQDAARRAWRWEATRQVRPIAQLKTYIEQQAGSLVFFLTRSREAKDPQQGGGRERIVDSAMRIGKSLGMDEENLEALRVAGVVHEMAKMAPPREEGEQFFVSVQEAMESGRRCDAPGCENTGRVRLLDQAFCGEHFIATCYKRLDECAERLGQRPEVEGEAEQMRAFLCACVEQATELTRHPFHQEALERARLLDILYTAGDLIRHMRRSPRRPESIPVRLLCETPGRGWEEESRTKSISRHGAMLECAHLVRPEDWLSLERLDTGRKVRARMAWRGRMAGFSYPVAVEFLDADNFWEQSWGEDGSSAKAASAGK